MNLVPSDFLIADSSAGQWVNIKRIILQEILAV